MKNALAKVSPVFYSHAEHVVEGASKETFDKWLDSSGRKMKEFADHSIVKDALERGEGGEKTELPEGFDTALRDKLVEGLRESGVPVSTDWEESQRLVDKYNGKNVRFNMGDGPETFTERQRQAVENKGTVMPGLNDAKVKVVDVPRHPYKGSWLEAVDAAVHDAIEKYTRPGKDNDGKEIRVPIPKHYNNFGAEFDYGISRKSIEESINEEQIKKSLEGEAARGVHLAILNSLDKVIGESIEIEEHPDYIKKDGERKPENGFNKNILVHRFVGAIKVDGNEYCVKTTMLEYKQSDRDSREYAYDVTKIEVLDDTTPNTSVDLDGATKGLLPLAKVIKKLKKSYDSGKKILDESEKADKKLLKQGESEENYSFHKVEDAKTLNELEKGPTVKRLRAMQMVDGKLYPPMSGKVDGEWRKPTEIGVWEQSEERPDLLNKDGKFVLKKGLKGEGRGDTPAAYNPYFHTSTSGLNDQFTAAYKRPELVVVEVEIPESELTSGYQAKGAKDHVGDIPWHSGVVNGALPKDRQRTKQP